MNREELLRDYLAKKALVDRARLAIKEAEKDLVIKEDAARAAWVLMKDAEWETDKVGAIRRIPSEQLLKDIKKEFKV